MRSTIKRTIAYILVLMLVLTMTPAFAFADEETEDVTAVRDLLFNGEMIADEGETADNDELFNFTIEEAEAMGYDITEMTRDLTESGLEAAEFRTEYEEKFIEKGIKIKYLRIEK